MTEKSRLTPKDLILLLSGVMLGFLLQLLYDTFREEPLYQSIMPTSYWRSLLAIICGLLIIVMLSYALKRGKTQKEVNGVTEGEKTEDNKEVRMSEGLKETEKKSFVLWISKWQSLVAYSIVSFFIGIFLILFSREFFPRDLVESRVADIATIQTGLCGVFIAFIGLVIFFYVRKMSDIEKDAISKSFDYSVKFAEFAKSQKKIEGWHTKEIDHYYKILPSRISKSTSSAITMIIFSCVFAIALLLVSAILAQFSLSHDASLLSPSLTTMVHGIAYFVYSWFGYEEVLRNFREVTLLLEEAMTAVKLELTFHPKGRSK